MYEVEMPDGVVLEFPDGMSEHDMQMASRKYWDGAQVSKTLVPSPPTIQQAPEQSLLDKVTGFFDTGLSDKERAQSAIAVTNAEDQGRRPHEFMGPDRNVIADVALNFTRGALADAPETMLRAGRTLGLDTDDEIEAVQDFSKRNFPQSFQALNQPLRRDMTEGASSSAASMVTGIPGLAAGAVGGPVGMATGYATSGGTIYGLAEYDRFMEEAKNAGLNPDDVKDEAILAAVTEGGLEGVSNLLDMALMKVGKPITSAAANRLKQFATSYVNTVASEVPTEMTQSAAGVAIRNKAGFKEQSPWEAAKASIRPTLFSGVGFAGAGTLSRRHKPIPQDKPTDLLNEDLEKLEEKPVQAINPESFASASDSFGMPAGEFQSHPDYDPLAAEWAAREKEKQGIDNFVSDRGAPRAFVEEPPASSRFRPDSALQGRIEQEMKFRGGWRPESFEDAESLSPKTVEHLAPTPAEETYSLSGPDAYVEPGSPRAINIPGFGDKYREQRFRESSGMFDEQAPEVREHPNFDPLEAEWNERERSRINSLSSAAHEAATSPVNNLPEPTQAQKEAGNYKKGHARVLGMDITIENPAGSERSGKDESGKGWSVQMQHHYGYIKGTEGKDKDHLDLFIKDGIEADQLESKPVYVVDQINEDGSFDEHKIMAGFENEQEARAGYLSNYEEDWNGLGAITEMSPEKFKEWIKKGNTKRAVGYKGQTSKSKIILSHKGLPFAPKGAKIAATARSRKEGKPYVPVEYEPGKWGIQEEVEKSKEAETSRGRADFQQRRESRIDRLESRAAKSRAKSERLFHESDLREDVSGIPFGQPILVGHHSEGKHRRAIERAHRKMDQSVAERKKADTLEQRAESAKSSTAIFSDDPEAVVKLKEKISGLEQAQERMKAANKVLRSKKHDDTIKIKQLVEQGFSESEARSLLKPDYAGRIGFPSYSLTNNAAKIRNTKKRLEQMQAQDSVTTSETRFNGGRIVDNAEENRLQIFFDDKPSEEIRTRLKRSGFKWARSSKAWQRHRSNQAMWLAEDITGANKERENETPSDFHKKVSKSEQAKIRLSFSKSKSSTGSTVSEVQSAIAELEAAAVNSGRTEVVQSIKDLPQYIQDEFNEQGGGTLEAAYSEGKVYLVSDSIHSNKRAVQLWLHEQGVHHGLRGFFSSKELKQLFNKVHLSAAKTPMYKAIVDLYGLDISKAQDREIAAEEYLAHIGEKVSSGEVLSGQEKTIWQRVVEMFRRWLNQLGFSKDATLTYEEIEQTVADVISWTVHGTAGQYDFTASQAVAYSKKVTEEQLEAGRVLHEDMEEWGRQLDDFKAGKLKPRDILHVGQTPEVLRKLGAKDLPMSMRQKIVKKITGGKRDIPIDILKELPRHMATPVMVFDSATMANSLVVITEMQHEGKPLVVAVHMDVHEGRINVNDVASVYGKDGNPGAWARRQAEEGRLRYLDKKRSPAWLRSFSASRGRDQSRLQLSGEMHSRSSRKKIITDKDIVKPVLPGDALRFSRGEMTVQQVLESVNEPEIRNFLNEKDLSGLQEVTSLPHWIAKRFPEFKRIYEVQLGRMEKRSAMFSDSLAEVEDFFTDLKKTELQEVTDMIWKLDGEKIKEVSESKFVASTDKDGKKIRENGRVVLESNPEFYEQFEKWLKTQGMSDKAEKTFIQVRKSLDNDFLRAYNAMRQMSDISDNDLDQFRQQINHVQNYFPHHRYGKYHIAGYETDESGKRVCVYREHYDAPNKLFAAKKFIEKREKLKKEYPNADWGKPGENQKLPEEVYGVPIDTNAMEQIIATAASSIADPEQAGDVRNKLIQAVSDTLKARGWGSHSIGRKNIPGHETEDVRRILYDYKAGLTGWLTKMEASKEMTGAVGEINARKNPKLYRYALTYVQNMLRNSDSIDRAVGNVKSLAFAWYLGGNIKTAALNLTQNIISGAPRLGMETSAGGVKVFSSAASSIVSAVNGSKNLSKDERKLLDDLYKEGTITEAFLDEIRGEVSGISGSRMWNKTLKWLGMPMAIAERFNRATLALAAYRVARDGQLKRQETKDELGIKAGEKATYEQCKQFSETIVNDAHFVYGKANLPQPFRSSTAGRIGSAMYTFRTFSHNLLSLWSWMLKTQGAEGAKAFGKSVAGTAVLGGVTALPFYYSAMAITQALTGDDDDWTEEIRKKLPEHDLTRDIVCYGVPSVAGISMGGSLGLEMPLARHIEPGASAESIVAGNLGEILGIPWDLFVVKPARVAKYNRAGDGFRAVEEVAPTVLKNMMKAYRMYNEGQTSVSGRPINEPGQVGARRLELGEAIKKGFGFQPLESTKNWNNYRARSISSKLRKDKLANLSNRLIRAIRDSDRERMIDIFDDLNQWNKAAAQDKKAWLLIMPTDLSRGIKSRAKARGVGERELFRLYEQMKAE